MKGQGEEHDKRHFPLSSGERLKVYKLNLSPCTVFSFITYNMGTNTKPGGKSVDGRLILKFI